MIITARTLSYNPELWLVSPKYDLLLIIFSSVLLIIPHFFSSIGGMTSVVVDLLVTALIGGPHLFATYTMIFMEPNFRKRYRTYTWGALLMPLVVVTLAIINLTLLVTIFFFWASVHVIHQALYIADSYRNKDPRWRDMNVRKWRTFSRIIDYGLLMTSLYPIATFKFTGTPLWLGGVNVSEQGFETGGRGLLFPEFLKQEWLAYVATLCGLIGSKFISNLSKQGSRLYWLCFAFTIGAAGVYLLVRFIVTASGVWTDPMQIHYFSFYSVILSALLIHYYFDHFLFLQVDDVITPKWEK